MPLVMAEHRLFLTLAMLGLLIVLIGGGIGLRGNSASAGPTPPANDDFASAALVGEPLPFSDTVDTTAATTETGEPLESCGSSEMQNTVWYTFTPSADVVVTADTFASDFDARIVVYVGDTLESLALDTCLGSSGEVVLPTSAGVTYSFQVGGVDSFLSPSTSGSLSFQMTVKPPPIKGNDDFADSVIIPEPLPFSNTQNVRGATFEAGEPHSCVFSRQTVWYSFTPSVDVVVTADTFGSDFAAGIVVYVGNSLATLVPLACQGAISGEVVFPTNAGVTYSIQVEGFGFPPGGGSLSFQMTVKPPPIKGNDDFADSVLIPEPLPFTNMQNVRGATLEAGEPRSCHSGRQTVWYSFTPTSDAVLTASISGSDFDAKVAAYRGTSLGTLTAIGCHSTEPRPFTASAGVTYYFQVGTGFGNPGNLVFNLSSAPCPAAPQCEQVILNVQGGTCDDANRPTKCEVLIGAAFTLSVEILGGPVEGYAGAQSFLQFGTELQTELTYIPAASAAAEIVWPDCDPDVVFRGQWDNLTGNTNTDYTVNHGCLTGLISPPPSHYTGTFLELQFVCSAEASQTEVRQLPYIHHAFHPGNNVPHTEGHTVQSTSGSSFLVQVPTAGENFVREPIIPKLTNLTINCVPPPTPLPTATPPDIPIVQKCDVAVTTSCESLVNVFLTRQSDDKIPPLSCLAGQDIGGLSESLSGEILTNDPKGDLQLLAAFEFEVHYDATKVCVEITQGEAFAAAGAVCAIEDSSTKPQLENVARIGCVTQGKGHDIDQLTALADIKVRPQPDVYSQAKPNQGNGVVVQINNVDCDLGDQQGHAIAIFSCDDADITFRYLEGDVVPDCLINASDAQAIAFRWGIEKGSVIYRDFMNLEPSGAQGDNDIDINDLQFVYGRFGSSCANPHPPQPPVNPKA